MYDKEYDIQETGKGFSTLFLLEVLSAIIAEGSTGESLDVITSILPIWLYNSDGTVQEFN